MPAGRNYGLCSSQPWPAEDGNEKHIGLLEQTTTYTLRLTPASFPPHAFPADGLKTAVCDAGKLLAAPSRCQVSRSGPPKAPPPAKPFVPPGQESQARDRILSPSSWHSPGTQPCQKGSSARSHKGFNSTAGLGGCLVWFLSRNMLLK